MTTEEGGGGASRSTDPASGSSAATDVSLREFVAVRLEALDRHVTSEIQALRRETITANKNAENAIEVAAHEAADRLASHNGLIDQMQKQQSTFLSREVFDNFKDSNEKRVGRVERFQSMTIGGLVILSAIGVSTLVKVFTG